MIRTRLQELLSGLTAIDKRGPGGDYMLLSGEVIQAIINTVSEGNQLGKRCIESTYNGRLFMQSDLSKLVSTLDTHIEYLSDIYTVGLCIFVEKPGVLACKDDKIVYMNDLLSRLKIGDAYMKKEALVDFNKVIQEDEEFVDICVETNGVVSVLVSFLDSEVIKIQEESAKAVCEISKYGVYRGVLASAGMIPRLISVLECGSRAGKEFAARCLMNVSEKSSFAWSILGHDGVTVLLEIGRNIDVFGSELVVLACEVLKNLSWDREINEVMVEQGALEVFIALAKSRDEVVLLSSIDCLQIMVCIDESNRDFIVEGGGIFVLVDILNPKSFVSWNAGAMALEAIMILCLESTSTLNIVLDYGLMDHLLDLLQHKVFFHVQDLALKATIWLCETSEEAKEAMGDAGFMSEIVKFLDAESTEVCKLAAKALSSMISAPKNRKAFVQNQEHVNLLAKLLYQEEVKLGDDIKLLASILVSLTSTASGRKRIANSGYFQDFEKLVGDDVSDTQNLARKSTSDRLSSMFGGMLR